MDAAEPFARRQALQPGGLFSLAAQGQPVKNSLQRYQDGGTLGFPIQKDKTFLFAAFEGLRQNAQNAVPLLTNTGIFRPTAAENAVIAGLLSPTAPAAVGCLNLPNGTLLTLPSSICAFALDSIFTVNPSFDPL